MLKGTDRLVGDQAGFLVLDDTALPKKGQHSVDVAPQPAAKGGTVAVSASAMACLLEGIDADSNDRD